MSPRYAIYLAPEIDTPLWQLGSALLGYDAATGCELTFPDIPGIAPEAWHALTEEPRRYGFHLTMKAPFRLAETRNVADLMRSLEAFGEQHEAFDAGRFIVETRHYADGTGFVCLAPEGLSHGLLALEAAAVPYFEPFRAPLSETERARRKPDLLPERERDYLDRFGYPFVLDAFRPHFSLTERHANPERTAAALSSVFEQRLGDVRLDSRQLFLFEQPQPAARFVIRARVGLG